MFLLIFDICQSPYLLVGIIDVLLALLIADSVAASASLRFLKMLHTFQLIHVAWCPRFALLLG
jgi:hypothetical protein